MMVPAEYRVFLLMGGAILAGALLGAMLMHKKWPRAFGAIFIGHVLAALGLFVAARQAQGMEGVSYAIMLSVFVLPATLGMALGAGAMVWRARRG